MLRNQIISVVGNQFLTANVENDEFNYESEYRRKHLAFNPISSHDGSRTFKQIDLRFVKDNVSVLIETKRNIESNEQANKEQLRAYAEYERNLTHNKVVSILASTDNDKIKVWRGSVIDSNYLDDEKIIKEIKEYVDLYTPKVNDKEKVMKNTYQLNNILHKDGISEKIRSQFVGTCLLALKNGLAYKDSSITVSMIIGGIKGILSSLLTNDLNKATKLTLLNDKVLQSQDVRNLTVESFREILTFIDDKILPFINDKSTAGQDLLNLFFITFNKYVGKADKNQAFTPDHITDFMSKVVGVNRNSRILDPCCGSGSFLVRAMTQALDDCTTGEEQDAVKKDHIYGIEYDDTAFGLSTTNMLIHSDGNSNIIQGSCFDNKQWIKDANIDVVLMNPPYNNTRNKMPKAFVDTWKPDKKEDPTKGLYFVKYIASIVKRGKLAVLLPMQCAIGTDKAISDIKAQLLKENTLDAVFSLPQEMFYPGAAVSACCMVFNLGVRHSDPGNLPTFFGYFKEDGFVKRKNLGRVEQQDVNTGKSKWAEIEEQWLSLYRNRRAEDGLSAVQKVNADSEWLCEAYMQTDYSKMKEEDFQETIDDYLAYLVKKGKVYEAD